MSALYPGQIRTFTNPLSTDYQDTVSHSSQHTFANDEINAIETYLGTNVQGTFTDLRTRLNNIGSSNSWDYIVSNTGGTIKAFNTVGGSVAYSGTEMGTVMRSLMSDINTAGGGNVFIKPGTYTITSSETIGVSPTTIGFRIPDNTTVEGVKGFTTIAQGSGLGLNYMVTNWDHNPGGAAAFEENLIVRNLNFNANFGNQAYADTPTFHGAPLVMLTNNSRFENIYSNSFGNYGVITCYGNQNSIEHIVGVNGSKVASYQYAGVVFMSATTAVRNYISDIHGTNCEGAVLFFEDYASDNVAYGIYEEACRSCVQVNPGDRNKVFGVYSQNSNTFAVGVFSGIENEFHGVYIGSSLDGGVKFESSAVPGRGYGNKLIGGFLKDCGRTSGGYGAAFFGGEKYSQVIDVDTEGTGASIYGIYLVGNGLKCHGGYHQNTTANVRVETGGSCIVEGIVALGSGIGIQEVHGSGTCNYNLFHGNNVKGCTGGTINSVGTNNILADNMA